jgi:hyperosmotically inducible protein
VRTLELCLLAFALLLASPLTAQSAPPQQPPSQSDAAPAVAPAQEQQAIPALPAHKLRSAPANEEERIAREVRHELVMQPYYTIWDWLAFRVHGSTVELLGYVHSVGLQRNAVNTVKHIKGVDQVVDHIKPLPLFASDDRIRKQVARAIFSFDGLSRYSWTAAPSIHIIVDAGRVRLEGVVDSQPDKDAAGLRANGVPGVFEVTNNLRVVKS